MELPERVRAGLDALRGGRAEAAVALLLPVAEDADLAAQSDMADIRARVCSLLAQSLLETGDLRAAEHWAGQAATLATALGDAEGEREIRALRARVMGAAMQRHRDSATREEAARLAARPLEASLEGVAAGLPTAEVLLAKANAEIDVGRTHNGVALARRALVIARAEQGLRVEVLAHLTIARGAPAEAEAALGDAMARADSAGDVTLIGAVLRAAELAGIALPDLPLGGHE